MQPLVELSIGLGPVRLAAWSIRQRAATFRDLTLIDQLDRITAAGFAYAEVMGMAAQRVKGILADSAVADAVRQTDLRFRYDAPLDFLALSIRPVFANHDRVRACIARNALAYSRKAAGQFVGIYHILAVTFPISKKRHQYSAS